MSPTAEQLERTAPCGPMKHLPTRHVVVNKFDDAIGAAALAIANADRVLRGQWPVRLLCELHPDVMASCQAAALEAVLEQHPAARMEAADDAGEELRQFVEKALTDPEPPYAVTSDPELLKAACVSVVKVLRGVYRNGLAGQLAILRCADESGS